MKFELIDPSMEIGTIFIKLYRDTSFNVSNQSSGMNFGRRGHGRERIKKRRRKNDGGSREMSWPAARERKGGSGSKNRGF